MPKSHPNRGLAIHSMAGRHRRFEGGGGSEHGERPPKGFGTCLRKMPAEATRASMHAEKFLFLSMWGTVMRPQGRQVLDQLLPGGTATCKAAENRLTRSSTRLGEGPGEMREPWGTRSLHGEAEVSRRYFKRPTPTSPSLSPSASFLLI